VQQADERYCVDLLLCNRYQNNAAAIAEVRRLRADPSFVDPFILSENGSVIWESSELLDECSSSQSRPPGGISQ
jgi:hypothetical protein